MWVCEVIRCDGDGNGKKKSTADVKMKLSIFIKVLKLSFNEKTLGFWPMMVTKTTLKLCLQRGPIIFQCQHSLA